MSSGGVTLQGSFSGETGTISEVGFYYGTTSNPSTKVVATGTSSPFTKVITGLSESTTYYYKAYVIEGGQERTGSVVSFTTPSLGTVTTGSASNATASTVNLSASYADVVTGTHAPQDIYFKYGTSSGNLNKTAYYNNGLTASSGSFSVYVTGLTPNTTYYYKVYMSVWNGTAYQEISGSVQTFSTTPEVITHQGYLGCYEMPSVSVSGTGTSGYFNTRDDQWYRYNTSSSNQKVVTHTFTGSTRVRNYTVLFDGDKHAPLWTAFPMHANVYGGSTERSNSWTGDPALTSYSNWQQDGLDDAGTVGYSRGHFVASQYRKKNEAANLQTFYYSNQAPQWQNGFNSGVWSTLETQVLNMSPSTQSDTLYVVVGVLYEESFYTANPSFPRTLPADGVDIPIPTHFYTCLMKCSFNSGGTMTGATGIAFVYSNESHSGDNYNDSKFVTSIDAIETRAGFDFFANVPPSLQTTAEQNGSLNVFNMNSNISSVSSNNWGAF